MNTQVEQFFDRAKKWKEEFDLLRAIIRENESLEEDYKWMHPCYTYGKKNVVLIHGFKEYCALLFHKGALLRNAETSTAEDEPIEMQLQLLDEAVSGVNIHL